MKSNNIIFKDVKEFNIIFLILIGLFLVGISGYSSYAIFTDEIISNNEIKGIIKKQNTPGAETIVKKVGKDGIVAETHPATKQLAATTDYRYTGKNPNNYIKFNNETWRIIGVFEIDDGKGNLEKRIKLIREPLAYWLAWDDKAYESPLYENRSNDWSKATGMQFLNSGDYWNRTGDYATTGLTEEAKSQIADAKWYLGGTKDYQSASNGLASHFYSYERGTTVYSGKPTSWVGKAALMYPSDYGYATSGGDTTSRVACLATALYSWKDSGVSDCKNNDWLYDSNNLNWILTPYSGNDFNAFYVASAGGVNYYSVYDTNAFRPTVYLKSDIKITGGTGTSTDPYTLPESGTTTLIKKVGTDGLVKEEHPATEQLVATTDYRYTGKDPNNYIKFNNEIWRIIGVFDTDDGAGNLEKRIKIIRNESLGKIAWSSGDGNDWSNASAMTLLNSGDYWNRTGDYVTNGLTTDAKSLIADAKWYLGGVNDFTSASNGLASHFYSYERGTTVCTEDNSFGLAIPVTRPTSWIGKVGLMYPSDYGYATGGGTTTSRDACLAKEMYNWSKSEVSDCNNNDWLYDSNGRWALTPKSTSANDVFLAHSGFSISEVWRAFALYPSIYLKSGISISGSGTSSSPYEISG